MKNVIDHTVRFLLFTNSWVALSVGSLVMGLTHHFRIESDWLWGLFAFSGTYTTYNFHRLVRHRSFEQVQISTMRTRWLKRYRVGILLSLVFFLLFTGISLLLLPIQLSTFWVLGIAGIIVLTYAIPIPFLGKSLREIGGLKSSWIAFVWMLLLLFPFLQYPIEIPYFDILLLGVFTFVQIIPFDIRDIRYDAKNMYTLPQLMGITGARIMGTLIILIVTIALVYHHDFRLLLVPILASMLVGLWWKQRASNVLFLELLWDGALILVGCYYYFI